jgi:hypothetical protein
MATSDITKVAVFDARIQQPSPAYSINKGSLALTNSPYNSIAATASQATFNVNAPSQNTFVARDIDWTGLVKVQFGVHPTTAQPAAGVSEPVAVFGRDVALAPYPLHQMVQTQTATINDTTTTVNTADVLDVVLRLTDSKKNRWIKNSPAMLDKFAKYSDAAGSIANPLASYIDMTEGAEIPNGAWAKWDWINPNTGQVLSGSASYAFNGITVNYVNGIPIRTQVGTAEPAYYPVAIQFESTERLILPPFIFNDEFEGSVGLFGINAIQFIMNFKSTLNRLIRFCPAAAGREDATSLMPTTFCTGSPWATCKLNIQYLTPSLDLPLPSKSVVSYLEYPRYVNAFSETVAAGAEIQVQSQTIVLPNIPDMLIIYARPLDYINAKPDFGDIYLSPTNISLNFDNVAGLLSSHTKEELYRMAVNNGLPMDFYQWSGEAQSANKAQTPGALYEGKIPLAGGFLVLRPGKDFAVQTGMAPGLLGNFVLQYNIRLRNTLDVSITNFQLFTVAVNSGYFETMAGSSRIIKGILSEADILNAPAIESDASLSRMVGGGFMDKLGSFLSKAKDIYTATKPYVSQVKGMLPESGALGKVKGALGAVGYGAAGAGLAGAAKGGRRKSISSRLM